MPKTQKRKALELLNREYDRLSEIHTKNTPRGIPVGGGDWMDSFFRLEGVRGFQNAVGRGLSIAEGVKEGKLLSEIAVRIWNQRREWQVHRWDQCCHSYLEKLARRIKQP